MSLVVVRLRGNMNTRRDSRDTLNILGLKRVNTVVVLPEKKEVIGMIRKIENLVAWGELSPELKLGGNVVRLKPAKGGLRSVKAFYPKGDLGYRGKAINDLVKRMM